MKLKLVSFETAKKLKEVGFPWYSHKPIFDNGKLIKSGRSFSMGCASDYGTRFIPAPTLALVQMWLREKFDIHVFCVTDTSSSNGYYYVLEGENGLNYNLPYDEALEAGINEAIKLIKS